MPQDPERTSAPEQRRNFMQQFGRFTEIAFVLPAATVAGWFIGAELDKHFHTNWIYLVGLILGIIAGFIDLIRIVMAETK